MNLFLFCVMFFCQKRVFQAKTAEKGFLRPLMSICKLDIIGSYEEPCLLVLPQEKLISR